MGYVSSKDGNINGFRYKTDLHTNVMHLWPLIRLRFLPLLVLGNVGNVLSPKQEEIFSAEKMAQDGGPLALCK